MRLSLLFNQSHGAWLLVAVEMMEDLRHTVSSIPEAAEIAEADALPELTRRRVQGQNGSRNAYAPPGRPPGKSSLNGLGMADGHKGAPQTPY